MSLVHAILGLLEEEPRTGYDLKTQGFDRKVNHFWSADQAQIYRTLDKLVEQGWAESEVVIQQDHPNRKIYSITEAGKNELHRWQHEYQPLTPIREPFLVQFFFGSGLSNDDLIKLLENQIAGHQERLEAYRCLQMPALDDSHISRDQVLHRLTVELGTSKAENTIKWAQHAIEVIKNLK